MAETDLWERSSQWWQDEFTEGADPEYVEQIEPLFVAGLGNSQRLLDVGAGEGQLSRRAREAGVATVVGIDPTDNQLTVAARRGGDVAYIRGSADSIPLPDGSFDCVVACLVFEHIHTVDASIAEVARVLEPGGRFLFFLNHPLLQTPNSGWIDDHILEEQYWRIGAYLAEDETLEEVDKNVFIPFVHRPLSRYINALAGNSLFVIRMHEPAPPPGFLAIADEYQAASTIPRLLFLECVKQ